MNVNEEGIPWRQVMDEWTMREQIHRLGHEIAARAGHEHAAFIGIRSRGVPLAERLAAVYSAESGRTPEMGVLDITLYRDDLGGGRDWPEVKQSEIPFDVAGRTIVLVDDVLFTGRTIRAALNALMDYGRPKAVMLAVMVDRGSRELPIQADFTGYRIATQPRDHIRVRLKELDGADEIVIGERRCGERNGEAKS